MIVKKGEEQPQEPKLGSQCQDELSVLRVYPTQQWQQHLLRCKPSPDPLRTMCVQIDLGLN